MGVIQNGEVKQQTSPMEQAFTDECKSKGGTTGGTGGVKDRLPTTLPAGTSNCDYKDNGHTCWDVMTRTGQRLMGGDNGCTELNLLPKPAPTPNNPTIPTAQNWDGNYKVQVTKPNCDTSVEVYDFDVSGGEITNIWGKNAPIGSDGHATITFNTGTTMTLKLTFEKNGSKIVANGTWTTSRGCSGAVTATKSSSWF